MNKKILVPTDFSTNAESALNYATQLAQKNKLALHIFHAYSALSVPFDNESLNDSPYFKADILMQNLSQALQSKYPNLELSTQCSRELLTEVLPKIAAEGNYQVLIMGTQGASANKNRLIGSNTYALTQLSPIPVLAIPIGHDDIRLTNVGLLSNFKEEELEVLQQFSQSFGHDFRLKLMHVELDPESQENAADKLALWKYRIQKQNPIQEVAIEIASIQRDVKELDSIPEVINEMIVDENIDILLVTKTRRSFFQRLFTRSVSKTIALRLLVPTFFSKIN